MDLGHDNDDADYVDDYIYDHDVIGDIKHHYEAEKKRDDDN